MTTSYIDQATITDSLLIELLSAPTTSRPSIYAVAQRLGIEISKDAVQRRHRRYWAKSKMRANRYRAKKFGAREHITAREWLRLIAHFGGCCRCDSGYGITIDHVIPLSAGGNNTARNVAPLCHGCHAEKNRIEKDEGVYLDYRRTLPDWVMSQNGEAAQGATWTASITQVSK